MVNRGAVILKLKEPFIKWANEVDPYDENLVIKIENANEECNVYLVSEDDAENFEQWITLNYSQLFESELEDWYTDEALWPKVRSRKLFDKWFSVECHSVIIDTVGGQIFDDEM